MRSRSASLRRLRETTVARRRDAITGELLVPVHCTCDPPREHGPHWVRPSRLAKGGDLRGKARVDAAVLDEIERREGS